LATDVDSPSTRTALQGFRDALAETRASLHAAVERAGA